MGVGEQAETEQAWAKRARQAPSSEPAIGTVEEKLIKIQTIMTNGIDDFYGS